MAAFAALAPVVTVGHMNVTAFAMLSHIDPIDLMHILGVQDFLGPSIMPGPIAAIMDVVCLLGPTWLSPPS